ncbi:MAG: fumarate hydratase [Merdibacter sp.]
MRTIAVDQIRDAICRMVQRINIESPDDIRRCMETALQKEQHPTARSTLQFLIRNAAIARRKTAADLSGYRHGRHLPSRRTGCAFHRRFPAGCHRSGRRHGL